jgi:hypothetical protein
MKGIVSLFGGVNSKLKHYNLALEVYKKHNFEVHFYEAPLRGLGILVPSQYKKNVIRAENNIMKHSKQIDTIENIKNIPKIIHSHSGGFWTGLDLNRIIPHNHFIIESAPFNCYDIDKFVQNFNEIILNNNRLFSYISSPKNIPYFMKFIGVPTLKYNPTWFEEYEEGLSKLTDVTMLNSKKDEYLDQVFLEKFQQILLKKNVKLNNVPFTNGKHFSVGKSDPGLYQERLEVLCKEIIKSSPRKIIK